MEIFFDEISHFLTRFGNLEWFDWLKCWSHDFGMRFHEIWWLNRLLRCLVLKQMSDFTLNIFFWAFKQIFLSISAKTDSKSLSKEVSWDLGTKRDVRFCLTRLFAVRMHRCVWTNPLTSLLTRLFAMHTHRRACTNPLKSLLTRLFAMCTHRHAWTNPLKSLFNKNHTSRLCETSHEISLTRLYAMHMHRHAWTNLKKSI